MTTRIYLDVDGVLNAYHHSPKKPFPIEESGWERWIKTEAGWDEPVYYWAAGIRKTSSRVKKKRFPIRYSPQLIEALNEIAEMDDVEIVWLTTWSEHAGQGLSSAIGLNGSQWRVLKMPNDEWTNIHNPWWKSIKLREDIEQNGAPDKLIWLDDHLHLYGRDTHSLISILSDNSDVLAIAPIEHVGLTSDDVCGIIDFINSPQG